MSETLEQLITMLRPRALKVLIDMTNRQAAMSRMNAILFSQMSGIDVGDLASFDENGNRGNAAYLSYFQTSRMPTTSSSYKIDNLVKLTETLQYARNMQAQRNGLNFTPPTFKETFCGSQTATCKYKQVNVNLGGEGFINFSNSN